VFVPVTQSRRRPSPEAHILSQRIDSAIRDYLANNPGTSEMEVLQALDLSKQRHRGGLKSVQTGLAIAVGALVFALGLGVFLARSAGSEAGPESIPWIAIAVGAALVAILLARIRRGS
jgi:hypothetical protein